MNKKPLSHGIPGSEGTRTRDSLLQERLLFVSESSDSDSSLSSPNSLPQMLMPGQLLAECQPLPQELESNNLQSKVQNNLGSSGSAGAANSAACSLDSPEVSSARSAEFAHYTVVDKKFERVQRLDQLAQRLSQDVQPTQAYLQFRGHQQPRNGDDAPSEIEQNQLKIPSQISQSNNFQVSDHTKESTISNEVNSSLLENPDKQYLDIRPKEKPNRTSGVGDQLLSQPLLSVSYQNTSKFTD